MRVVAGPAAADGVGSGAKLSTGRALRVRARGPSRDLLLFVLTHC